MILIDKGIDINYILELEVYQCDYEKHFENSSIAWVSKGARKINISSF